MKLKTFDRTQSKMRLSKKPAIRISKVGLISLNKCAIRLLDLKVGDKIKFYQDEDNPEDWYLKEVPKTDDLGLICRNGSSFAKSIMVNSAATANALFESIGFTGTTLKCQIGSEPDDYLWAIITASGNKNNES